MEHYDLAAKVLITAKTRGWKITTAESCTGGMIAAALTDVAGSSAVFDRGFVTYSYHSKTEMLGVTEEMLKKFGAVSEPVVRQMAIGALDASNADITIAATGVAGPGADGDKAEGLVWLGLATPKGIETTYRNFGAIGCDNVRLMTVETVLNLLYDKITRA